MKKILLFLLLGASSAWAQESSETVRRAVQFYFVQSGAIEDLKLALALPSFRAEAIKPQTHTISLALEGLPGYDWDLYFPGSDNYQKAVAIDHQQAEILRLLLEAGAKKLVNEPDFAKRHPVSSVVRVSAVECLSRNDSVGAKNR